MYRTSSIHICLHFRWSLFLLFVNKMERLYGCMVGSWKVFPLPAVFRQDKKYIREKNTSYCHIDNRFIHFGSLHLSVLGSWEYEAENWNLWGVETWLLANTLREWTASVLSSHTVSLGTTAILGMVWSGKDHVLDILGSVSDVCIIGTGDAL